MRRFSWIIWVDHKGMDMQPSKRDAEGNLIHTKEEKTVWPQRQRMDWRNRKLKPTNGGSHQKLGARRGKEQRDAPPESLEGSGLCQHFNFGSVIDFRLLTQENTLLLFESTKFMVFSYDSHRKLIKTLCEHIGKWLIRGSRVKLGNWLWLIWTKTLPGRLRSSLIWCLQGLPGLAEEAWKKGRTPEGFQRGLEKIIPQGKQLPSRWKQEINSSHLFCLCVTHKRSKIPGSRT